jgi:excisionase family DNA binding protein
VTALRNELIGDRVTIEQIAAALDRTTRSIYNLIDRNHIPFVRILGARYLRLDDVRQALIGNPAPRRRGRPRKA